MKGTSKYSNSSRIEVWHNQALLLKNKEKMKSGSIDKKSEKIIKKGENSEFKGYPKVDNHLALTKLIEASSSS